MTQPTIEALIRSQLDPKRDKRSNPVKGTLKNLALNYSIDDGWQAIASFWFVEKWFVGKGPDPVQCMIEALTQAAPPTELPKIDYLDAKLKSDFDDLLG